MWNLSAFELSTSEDNPLKGARIKGRAWHTCATPLVGAGDDGYYCSTCQQKGWLKKLEAGVKLSDVS